jgi:hypothetical protein
VKYAFIERHRRIWPICVQCRVLEVSVSGFHQHRARRRKIATRRHLTDAALLAHGAHKRRVCRTSWSLWLASNLAGTGQARHSRGKQRVQRLMQKHGIRARGKRRFRVATTDSRHDLPIAPNVEPQLHSSRAQPGVDW